MQEYPYVNVKLCCKCPRCGGINRKRGRQNLITCEQCEGLFCYICNKPQHSSDHYLGQNSCREESDPVNDLWRIGSEVHHSTTIECVSVFAISEVTKLDSLIALLESHFVIYPKNTNPTKNSDSNSSHDTAFGFLSNTPAKIPNPGKQKRTQTF